MNQTNSMFWVFFFQIFYRSYIVILNSFGHNNCEVKI